MLRLDPKFCQIAGDLGLRWGRDVHASYALAGAGIAVPRALFSDSRGNYLFEILLTDDGFYSVMCIVESNRRAMFTEAGMLQRFREMLEAGKTSGRLLRTQS